MQFRVLWSLGFVCCGLLWAVPQGRAASDVPLEPAGMTLLQSALLGAVEGFTEYLPVSSTGHLILTQRAMGIGQTDTDNKAADAFSISIQAGAILAVLTLYFPYVRRMAAGIAGKDRDGLRLLINLIVAFLPAAAIGLLLQGVIKKYLFGLWPIVFAWFVGGVAILAVHWQQRRFREAPAYRALEALRVRDAWLIGCMQCIAMWPGTSRSLVTIAGGLLAGMSLSSAVIFSFLLGVVTLSAATAYDTLKHGALMLDVFGPLNLTMGFLMATVTAIASVKWFLAWLKKYGLSMFGYYRIVLAAVTAILLLSGRLADRL